MKKVCFTGYRPHKLPFKIHGDDNCYLSFCRNAEKLIKAYIKLGYNYFISAMAQGADILLADIVLKLKKEYLDVLLECALPFYGHSQNWTAFWKDMHDKILNLCDKITIVRKTKSAYSFLLRNKCMVDCCDIVIAVYDVKKAARVLRAITHRKKGVRS